MKRRFGFTLVELVIVIMVIGVLVGSLMLTRGDDGERGEAVRIVSDLRTLRMAALMYYADNMLSISEGVNHIGSLDPYMKEELPAFLSVPPGYSFENISGEWYVLHVFESGKEEVKARLERMAESDRELQNEHKTSFRRGDARIRMFVRSDIFLGGNPGDDGDVEEDDTLGAVPWSPARKYPRGAVVYLEQPDGSRVYYVNISPTPASSPETGSGWVVYEDARIRPEWEPEAWNHPPAAPPYFPQAGYPVGSLVRYQGAIYIKWNAGYGAPGTGDPWQKVTNEWDNNNIYHGGVEIWHNGGFFYSRYYLGPGAGAPGTVGVAWQEITNQWKNHNIYNGGDVVVFNSVQYRAKYYRNAGADPSGPPASAAWALY